MPRPVPRGNAPGLPCSSAGEEPGALLLVPVRFRYADLWLVPVRFGRADNAVDCWLGGASAVSHRSSSAKTTNRHLTHNSIEAIAPRHELSQSFEGEEHPASAPNTQSRTSARLGETAPHSKTSNIDSRSPRAPQAGLGTNAQGNYFPPRTRCAASPNCAIAPAALRWLLSRNSRSLRSRSKPNAVS